MNIKYKPIVLYILEKYIDEIMTESVFFFASAYAIKGEYAKGLEVLDNRFKGPAIRKRYAKAFEYLKTKLGEI